MSQQTTVEAAIPSFARYACIGDSVEWEREGFNLKAFLEFDHDSVPTDFMDLDDPLYGAENRKRNDAWLNEQWFYAGVVIGVSIVTDEGDEVCLDRHAASLWGVECNISEDNSYLGQLLEDLEHEALANAKVILEGVTRFDIHQ